MQTTLKKKTSTCTNRIAVVRNKNLDVDFFFSQQKKVYPKTQPVNVFANMMSKCETKDAKTTGKNFNEVFVLGPFVIGIVSHFVKK